MGWLELNQNRDDISLKIIGRNQVPKDCWLCPFLSQYPSAAKCFLLDKDRRPFAEPFCEVTDFIKYVVDVV